MATPRQIEANRRNAQKSTGPRTKEGKERSRFNGVKHGMTATFDILPGEDAEAYRERLDAFMADFKPRDAFERELVEQIVQASWLLDRVELAHLVRLTEIILEAAGGETPPGGADPQLAGLDAYTAARIAFEDSRECERFFNYVLSCERELLRAIETFHKTRQAGHAAKSVPTSVGVGSATVRPAPADRRIRQNEAISEPMSRVDDEPITSIEQRIPQSEPNYASVEQGIGQSEPDFACVTAAKATDDHRHRAKVRPHADRRSQLSARTRCHSRRYKQRGPSIASGPTRAFTSCRRLLNDRRSRGSLPSWAVDCERSTRWIESRHDPPRRLRAGNHELIGGLSRAWHPWDRARRGDPLDGFSRWNVSTSLRQRPMPGGRCYFFGPYGNLN
jgi:hypothetical protein